VREALFSSIESELGTLVGRRFLDVYAGSGAVGLEARSRGASYVLLVEKDRPTASVIISNVRDLGFSDVRVESTKAESLSGRAPSGGPFDVAFLDPPYAVTAGDLRGVLLRMGVHGWFAHDALVVVERGRRDDWTWPVGFEPVRSKRYGETMLWYAHWGGAADE
jgi:16S rRNA (guanine966-N2)-methyltransferase